MTTQMVFLVGGLGTRLGERSRDLPKPLQPVAGKPFLGHLIEHCGCLGIQRVLLLAGHLGEKIVPALTDVDLRFTGVMDVTIEPSPMGTGGALRLARGLLDDTFLLANGDSFFGFDWSDLARDLPHEAIGRLALRRVEDASRYGVVSLSGARITGFEERGQGGPALINGGVYLLRREILDRIGEGPQSIERDVFPALVDEGRLFGQEYAGAFIDIGVPSDLERAQSDLPDMIAATRAACGLDPSGW